MTRQAANMKLLQKLGDIILKYPDLRFSQILQNFDFVKVKEVHGMNASGKYMELVWKDEFYLESEDLLERVNERSND